MSELTDGVTVYSQPGCQPCKAVKRALDARGVPYAAVDIADQPDAAAYLEQQGWMGTPVVEVVEGGHVVAAWQGLRMGAINALGKGEEEMQAYDMRTSHG